MIEMRAREQNAYLRYLAAPNTRADFTGLELRIRSSILKEYLLHIFLFLVFCYRIMLQPGNDFRFVQPVFKFGWEDTESRFLQRR